MDLNPVLIPGIVVMVSPKGETKTYYNEKRPKTSFIKSSLDRENKHFNFQRKQIGLEGISFWNHVPCSLIGDRVVLDCLTQNIAQAFIEVDIHPELKPYVHFSAKYFSRYSDPQMVVLDKKFSRSSMFSFYQSFDGPEELAVYWKLSNL